jgi:alpha-mannosidase
MRFALPAAVLALSLVASQSALPQTQAAPDLRAQPTLYVVPYAHLDTQWRWEFPQTISEYLLKTMRVNFDYIDKYPHYIFNWTGANRYRLMKEYYPNDYARMKGYVAAGRWYPAGASVEENDVNLPSAESIFRQVLMGNTYYRREFGKASDDYMLPDCFGFPASLPTILAHAGVKGFSTQKMNANWQPAARVGGPNSPEQTPEGIAFNVGVWTGTDGESIIAALNPSGYGARVHYDLTTSPTDLLKKLTPQQANSNFIVDGPARLAIDGRATGIFADYHYVGTGDIGGATDEESVKLLEAIVTKGTAALPQVSLTPRGSNFAVNFDVPPGEQPVAVGNGPIRVIEANSDQLFRDLTPDMLSRMPTYKGDLELINHSAGSLTSQAYHKRWNRKNELLADAAEKASVAAEWLGGMPYPRQRLDDAWTLVLGGQFHDTAAGTATPRSYEFAQNDDVIALNQFADVLTSATQTVSSVLDTEVAGTPVVVYNPLNVARQDVVEIDSPFAEKTPKHVRVTGPEGKEVPSQVEGQHILFLARVPATGYAVFSVDPAGKEPGETEIKVSPGAIENKRYKVTLDANGDVASVFDRKLNRELLAAPTRLALSTDSPQIWPAWNMDFDQEQAAPKAYVSGPATVRVVEDGPVRAAIEVTRKTEGSTFVQRISLAGGEAGDSVRFDNMIEWRGQAENLKAVFPLAAKNKDATYNWEVGTIERPTAYENQFEVGSHHWIDLTDASGAFGATVLTDVKNASDKRDDHTLRLTLIRTPGFRDPPTTEQARRRVYSDQLNQDWGHHEITYGLEGHAGTLAQSGADWAAYRLSEPMVAFGTTKHPGKLGRTFSLVQIDSPDVRVLALKKAELSDDLVLRLVELHGTRLDHVSVKFASPIASAQQANGQEQASGAATVQDGILETSFTPFQPRTFLLKLGGSKASATSSASQPVALNYNLAAASEDDTHSTGGMDAAGNALPAEMLPDHIALNGITFQLAPGGANRKDALVPHGESVALPSGSFDELYVLAAAVNGDQEGVFRIGELSTPLRIEDWGGFIGQWDTRQWKPRPATTGGDHPAPLRQNWAVSANHAKWNLEDRGSPDWSPRYPDDYLGLQPGFIKRATLAWFASHHHTPDGLNEPYAYSYLFAYQIPIARGATAVQLPDNANIRILAMTVAQESPEVQPLQPLYDELPAH